MLPAFGFLVIAMYSVHSLLSPSVFPPPFPSLPPLKFSLVATALRIPKALHPQLLELESEMTDLMDVMNINSICADWHTCKSMMNCAG